MINVGSPYKACGSSFRIMAGSVCIQVKGLLCILEFQEMVKEAMEEGFGGTPAWVFSVRPGMLHMSKGQTGGARSSDLIYIFRVSRRKQPLRFYLLFYWLFWKKIFSFNFPFQVPKWSHSPPPRHATPPPVVNACGRRWMVWQLTLESDCRVKEPKPPHTLGGLQWRVQVLR